MRHAKTTTPHLQLKSQILISNTKTEKKLVMPRKAAKAVPPRAASDRTRTVIQKVQSNAAIKLWKYTREMPNYHRKWLR